MKVGKKVEGYSHHQVFMDRRVDNPLLATPMGPPEQTFGWSHNNLTDPRAGNVLKRNTALGDTYLMGAVMTKEFVGHSIMPLQVHSHTLW
ncbi:hypothetical protein D1007_12371 [Hordeum vulgare]|nr:hypothetical protein D1007_12371 [Hordeum vulgare]